MKGLTHKYVFQLLQIRGATSSLVHIEKQTSFVRQITFLHTLYLEKKQTNLERSKTIIPQKDGTHRTC